MLKQAWGLLLAGWGLLLAGLALLAAGCGPQAQGPSTAAAPPQTSQTVAVAKPTTAAATAPTAEPRSVADAGSAAVQPSAVQPSAVQPSAVQPAAGWPRQVQTPRGVVAIRQKPQRIHTLSVGLDEITFALVDPSRVVAVGDSTANPQWSNVADLAARVPKRIRREAEEIVATAPDLVVASPFTREELVKLVESAGTTVVVADLVDGVAGHEQNIRLLAHLYGEEERGEQLARQVRERLARVDALVEQKAPGDRPRVLMLIGDGFTAGAGSNEDGLIRRAGGINVAAEAGVKATQKLNIEIIPALKPDLILLVETDAARGQLQRTILSHPALQDLPAIKQQRWHQVTYQWVSTLSHWNVAGIEEMARLFYGEGH